tara:strand:- start:462 stop:605 length:144 start_codon:yes stop_codon:yes gene_type:complete
MEILANAYFTTIGNYLLSLRMGAEFTIPRLDQTGIQIPLFVYFPKDA